MAFNNQNLRYRLAMLNTAEKLIVINVAVFIINNLLVFLFGLSTDYFSRFFELPTNLISFLYQPWSIITYSFFHAGFLHIFFNMIWLYFASRIFLTLFDGKRFLNVYFLGVIAGGLLFLIAYNLFPVFLGVESSIIGASAGVMAILIYICTYIPNQEVLLFFFRLKLWYIGVFYVILDLIQIPSDNAGGHIAHLGGAAIGFIYARQSLQGKDFGAWFGNLADAIVNFFKGIKKSPLKTVHKTRKYEKASYSKSNNNSAAAHQKKIDEILDKISKSGYESLSKAEKDFLFKAGKD
ncbi:rhomboid family intramembrane serine protease [Zhouia sp. PK063]|uniref:rhomboid family intramembrane serine protease n=1 Tax=Zhouia sp. PK063 TaxID=3373602 RepID=UPI0037992822